MKICVLQQTLIYELKQLRDPNDICKCYLYQNFSTFSLRQNIKISTEFSGTLLNFNNWKKNGSLTHFIKLYSGTFFCAYIRKLDLNLRKKLVNCCIWSMALYGAETWTIRAADQKYLESFEMWCWRMMEKISWTDHVRNEEVLLRVNEQRNILHEIRKRKANWIGHILRRNCLLKQVIEGKVKWEMVSDKKTRKKT